MLLNGATKHCYPVNGATYVLLVPVHSKGFSGFGYEGINYIPMAIIYQLIAVGGGKVCEKCRLCFIRKNLNQSHIENLFLFRMLCRAGPNPRFIGTRSFQGFFRVWLSKNGYIPMAINYLPKSYANIQYFFS